MTKRSKLPEPHSWRPSLEDARLIKKLRGKLGVNIPAILRLGLRALAVKEGVITEYKNGGQVNA